MNKVFNSTSEAIADIPDGAVIMSAGFGLSGIPENLINALLEKGVKDLTIIGNNIGSIDLREGGAYGVALLFKNKQVRKFIGSFPGPVTKLDWFRQQYDAGKIDIEIIPQGTFNERIRCAAAGLGGVYVPTGVGTIFEEGKEKKTFNGKEYILELPLYADFALIKAAKGDTMGNLIYRYTAQNYNTGMAPAAKITIAEVEELLEPGELDANHIHTPSIFVQRIVKGDKYEKRV